MLILSRTHIQLILARRHTKRDASKVACTDYYQSIEATLTATLSDGSVYDISKYGSYDTSDASVGTVYGADRTAGGAGVGANFARGISSGTFAMASSFGSGEKAFAVSQTITVTDTRISVTSISHVTQWDSGNSFVGYYAASKEVRLKVVFSDGTMFEDILDSDVPVSTLVEITSSQDDAIKAVASFVELKANYYKAVTLTASSICSVTLNTNNEHPTITGTDEVYANLLATRTMLISVRTMVFRCRLNPQASCLKLLSESIQTTKSSLVLS